MHVILETFPFDLDASPLNRTLAAKGAKNHSPDLWVEFSMGSNATRLVWKGRAATL